jgi:hypothetical protein
VADTRPALVPYLGLKMLVDPYCKAVDLHAESNDPDTYTYSSNALWFGWYFTTKDAAGNPQDLRGMRKAGDRLIWMVAGETYQFDFLISDSQAIHIPANFYQGSHHNLEGSFQNLVSQKDPGVSPGTYTFSWWIGGMNSSYTMDCNYARADLSSLRLDKLHYNGPDQQHDDRLVAVPERLRDADANFRNYLPVP